MFEFKIFNEIDSECEYFWKKLEQHSINDYFQTYDYHKELITNYNIKSLNIVIIFYNNEPVALFPFFIKKYFLLKVLQFIGTKYSDYCNPLINIEFDKKLNKKIFNNLWNNIIKNIGNFDLFFLNNQFKKIKNFKNPLIYYLDSIKFSNIFRINLLENFNLYKKNIFEIDKDHHYEIHRTLLKKKKLEKNFKLIFEIKNLENTDLKLERLIETKIKTFLNRKKRINLDIKFANVFKNLSKKNSKTFFVSTLKVNGEIIAACFSIYFKDVFYYFIPVIFSRKFDKYKIGKILILDLIDWCIKKNFKIFDFGLGAEKYKKYFSNSSLDLFRYFYFNSFKGFILYLFLKVVSRLGIKQF